MRDKLITATAMFALCVLLSETLAAKLLNRPGLGPLVRLVALSIPFQAVFTTASSAFLGLDRMQDNALTLNIQSIVKTVSAPVLVLLGLGVVGALTGYVLGYAVAGTSALLFLQLSPFKGLANVILGGFLFLLA
jgi:O-antigen/teichoic acid export membrane protein